MNTSKFKRAYSLRIPRSPKPAAFYESPSLYGRLQETECSEDFQGLKETPELRDSTNFSWDIPLIDDQPTGKLSFCRRKWSSKSLKVPKPRMIQSETSDNQSEDAPERYKTSLWQEPEKESACDELSDTIPCNGRCELENDGEKQKTKKMKQYKKTIDRAFRRGWGNFINNIYTISLTRTSQDAPHLVKAC
ncbi:hypothetical protein GDO86_008511 [Hymenochirus boettgeri]|uniref:Uncharacterized protein n=1 Tax=Hymenochirus boettgeri TaxID=247094 RepID=A0A8T2J340_9PIPI|nr:hypothetical protein GDO86_008511 [Hymenochirus boettgeri]